MHSKLTRRWFLVTLIGVAQLVCLLLGEGWFVRRLEQTVRRQLESDALAKTRAAVTATVARLARATDAVEPKPPDVAEFVRAHIEPVGQDARIRAVDARSGEVLADSRHRHSVLPRGVCEPIILTDGRELSVSRLSEAGLTEARGVMRTIDGAQWVTARLVPEVDVLIVATKSQADVARATAAMISAVDRTGVLIVVFVSMLGFLMVAAIVQAYQHRLERMNDELDRRVNHHNGGTAATRDAIVCELAKLIESREDESGEHLDRIRDYVRWLADELAPRHTELDGATRRLLCVTSALHDIGKVGVPDAVLLKPGPLTSHERAVVQKHPTIGGDCLMALRERLDEDNPFLDMACEIAFAHHERWDGAGYPFGLVGEEIPLSARIVALADVYDALTTRRVYRPALRHEEAAKIIIDGAGTQFDPEVVCAFERRQEQFRRRAEQGAGSATASTDPHLDSGATAYRVPAGSANAEE